MPQEFDPNIVQNTMMNPEANQIPQDPGLFERVKGHWRGLLAAGAIGAATITGVIALEHQDLSALKQVDITEVGQAAIDVAEDVSPIFIAGSLAGMGILASTRPGRKDLELAWKGLAPTEKKFTKSPLVRGALLSTLGVGALTTALMIENGISAGADKNIASMSASVSGIEEGADSSELVWLLQPGTDHFMNNSEISQDIYAQVQTAAETHDGVATIQVFDRDLVTIPTPYSSEQAGMIISVQTGNVEASHIVPEVKAGATCEEVDGHCQLKPGELITDDNEGFAVGDTVTIRNQELTVVGLTKEDQSLINRLVAFTGSEELSQEEAYGLVAVANSQEKVEQLIADLNLTDELDAQSTEEFMKSNQEFWAHNGTPLIMLLIGDIALFAGASFAAVKGFEQQRDKAMLGGLRAIGIGMGHISKQERARVTMDTLKGAVPGYAGAVVATKLINSLLPGFHAEATPKMAAASVGVILAVQLGASAKSLRSMAKKSPVELMAQN